MAKKKYGKTILTPKKKKFAEEYLIHSNATRAAKAAGYSEKTAYSVGHDILKEPEIQEIIQAHRYDSAQRIGLTLDRILHEVERIALFDPRKVYDPHGNLLPVHLWDDDSAAAIASLETQEIWAGSGENRVQVGKLSKVKLVDKNSALEKLMKHFGGFAKDNAQKAEAYESAMRLVAASFTTEEKTRVMKNLLLGNV